MITRWTLWNTYFNANCGRCNGTMQLWRVVTYSELGLQRLFAEIQIDISLFTPPLLPAYDSGTLPSEISEPLDLTSDPQGHILSPPISHIPIFAMEDPLHIFHIYIYPLDLINDSF